MRRSQRLIAAAVLVSLCSVLAGCGGGGMANFDPSDLLDFLDTKKKLPGERKPVFPEGVPGLEQGVPKELYKNEVEQQQREQQAAEAAAAATPPPAEPAKPAKKHARGKPAPAAGQAGAPDAAASEEGAPVALPPEPKKKKVVRRRTTAPPPDDQQAQQPAAQPAAPAQTTQQSAAPFPAPLPSGSFSH
ncbi:MULTISPECIES: hypothetical protein [unclassified Bradyrhizobium]|uniref:hypothetical protein n=1 Tax=unclassified Bradyrhizobium TaxID=2631580 RepID=UPI002478EFEC|nr:MULTISPECIES: hypothetical protein [unclassified Bradyrhizobium]WGS17732.1 hypothetical protein MTX22_24245 [Bradyrhizobium sp. ISRA463]WGS24526.1 hypothetical protein MTX19_21910 [Bradyrhizobium sp. ISRA464]